ncbi:TetR/AcrR family transcriptional regulator C-terminal domain-containing protein [Planotetraspora phitsanulokensis]|uniref:Putative transcriptional regulator, TetR family protein n=1 Tax=Planotetraspora phitsanulokensis TaxID=575192 RepID=A0A8J3U9W7_9ACTN|nr:TetR/AcrR family transcriptional regulator C-terminal domain-containing protein [Planotetraspora phitsanulokensis]GII41443.1 putative transcriptional regulator, TetR family protein [Planotetraspora phitsanulokensis]
MAPEKLTRLTVIEKALELADAEGLEAVTIRRLAHELGVSPMALYWHFKNKELLLHGVADHVLAEVTPAFDPGASWSARLRAMVEALVRVLRRHPSMVGVFPGIDKEHVSSFTVATETALGLLAQAGFTLEEGYLISSHLLHGVLALVGDEPGCPRSLTASEAVEWRRQKRLSLESLPSDRYPHMVAFGKSFEAEPDVEHYYAFGVDLLLSGIEAMAAQRTPSAATPSNTR